MYVMSHLGCFGKPAGVNSPLLLYRIAYIQTAAASCTGEIPSCIDNDLEFYH